MKSGQISKQPAPGTCKSSSRTLQDSFCADCKKWIQGVMALEGYGAVHEPDFRAGGSFGGRRDEGFSRDSRYSRDAYPREMLDRDFYPPPPNSGMWSQYRRRHFDEEYAMSRDSRRPAGTFTEIDNFNDPKIFQETDSFHDRYRHVDGHYDADGYHENAFERHARSGARDRDEDRDRYDPRHRGSHESREDSREREYDSGRYDYESDQDKGRSESSWRRRGSRDHERENRGLSRERDQSPYGRRYDHSRSRGHNDRSRSRSPRGRNRGRSYREDSYDDNRYDIYDKRREYDFDEKRYSDSSVGEWGPLRHVRIIKERNSGVSRGFAFIDFPSVEAARSMMDGIGENGLVIDGRKLFFEYSSKPTGGAGAPTLGHEGSAKSGYGYGRSAPPSDWICTICGCINFARRISCFQCNEPRTDDAPPADMAPPSSMGRKGSDAGPTHVLVVRGLDENADEDMLRYEFSKYAPIKDLRLVRDKFTHVSRGFAFLHFHSVEDATKALEATNGTTLEKNGQVLRVAYAKSIHGPASGAPQSSSLAAAAIEAATFSQQYDAVGWAPKEYNPDDKQSTAGTDINGGTGPQNATSVPQAGFVWDEKSGYYYDAASGFYYDANSGLYYDGNNGIWYSYDHKSQQYVQCTDKSNNKVSGESTPDASKASSGANNKKIIISAPASTTKSSEKTSLADAVQAAASAALAAEKKEKEKQKEIKLASKSSIIASKKKMNNVLAMWKQRNSEGQAARVVLEDNEQPGSTDDKLGNYSGKSKLKTDAANVKEVPSSSGFAMDSQVKPRSSGNSSGGSIMGVIRGSGRGVIRADTKFSGPPVTSTTAMETSSRVNTEVQSSIPAFKTDASALGSYSSQVSAGSGKRRFSETPMQVNQPQTAYRDRAAERRSRYGSSSFGDELSDFGDSNSDYPYRKGPSSAMGAMPFPPGVGGGRPAADVPDYEVTTADRAIDESNVGNRMLRSMGWQEGSVCLFRRLLTELPWNGLLFELDLVGLGKDGSGIREPVQARAVDDRAGLGSQQRKMVDQSLEAQPGDSYKTIIQKKAIARFREMN
ncbi:Glycine-rich RNA-binding protein 3, mitochondrial [Apostasia shenzhenica]|uniref:Glycine-rich RNA-binding protein 3, mitochondrial n=1 Tax=Apostasia shenzhenica TaxID=1088818 RepID=A0A2I0B1I9_9ASPA|nr:Glycine-rich RNA-binding protein 3, mitochondrial [Apostasia shenzhenica]